MPSPGRFQSKYCIITPFFIILYLAFRDGKRKCESIFSEDAIAVGDDKIVLYDRNDSTISIYNLTGLLYSDPTWTKFSGLSIYKDMTLEDKIGSMIGYEESNLYFLEGDSHVLSFNSITGAFVKEWMFAFSSDSPLYGCTLGDVVDGRVDGWSYVGWDVGPIIISVDGIAVPEPAEFAAALGALAIGFLTFKRRKKQSYFHDTAQHWPPFNLGRLFACVKFRNYLLPFFAKTITMRRKFFLVIRI